MKRLTVFLASAIFSLVLLAPVTSGAQTTYYCNFCHEYAGSVSTLSYFGTTEVSGQQVSISGQATNPFGEWNAWMTLSYNWDYENFGQVHALDLDFGNAAVLLYNDSEQNIAGTFITDGKKFAGNSPMVGFITTAGDVWYDGFSEELFYGFPRLYLEGYGTILYFKGSADYVGKIKYNGENQMATVKLNLQPGSCGLVDVNDGEIDWDTWRAAPARIDVPTMNFVFANFDSVI